MTEGASQRLLSDAQVEAFDRRGFLVVTDVTTPTEIEAVKAVYDETFTRETGCSIEEAGRAARLTEYPLLVIYPPPEALRALKTTRFYRTAITLAARVLRVPTAAVTGGLRMFSKPARYAPTPWHQDAAYRPPPHETVSLWLPLDSMPRQSALAYIPGSHAERRVRAHRSEGDHLVTDEVDPALAVDCPVPVTAAVIHHCCTLHRAGPNATDRPRRALGVVCVPDKRIAT